MRKLILPFIDRDTDSYRFLFWIKFTDVPTLVAGAVPQFRRGLSHPTGRNHTSTSSARPTNSWRPSPIRGRDFDSDQPRSATHPTSGVVFPTSLGILRGRPANDWRCCCVPRLLSRKTPGAAASGSAGQPHGRRLGARGSEAAARSARRSSAVLGSYHSPRRDHRGERLGRGGSDAPSLSMAQRHHRLLRELPPN